VFACVTSRARRFDPKQKRVRVAVDANFMNALDVP
jgi:hypothetical protein